MNSQKGGQFSGSSQQRQSEAQRQTAASIARRRVLEAYGNGQGNVANATSATGVGSGATPENGNAVGGGNVANATSVGGQGGNYAAQGVQGIQGVQGAQNTTHLKDRPVQTRINSESWKQYHSAWQNYYQKYYSQYYAQAARSYVERERLKDARKQAEEDEVLESLIMNGRSKPTGSEKMVGKLKRGGGEGDAEVAGAGQGGGAGQVAPAGITPPSEEQSVGDKLRQTIRKKAIKDVKKSRRRRKWIPVLAGLIVVLAVLFLQYNRLIFAPIYAYVSPGNAPASQIDAIDPTLSQTVSAEPRLIIPKLNIDVPVYFGIPLGQVMDAMNSGVAHYRIAGASAFPGEVGNTIITGHSAGDVYSNNPYKYIFSGLERLEDGDLIYIHYDSVRYTYQVNGKQVVEPTEVSALVVETDVPMLTLVTCTPLGTSQYRLLVFADQISPNPSGAEPSDTAIDVESGASEESALPSNEPTFFEKIWEWLTGA